MNDEKLDALLNRILHASGSDIKHYTLRRELMRDAMRGVLRDAGEGWYAVSCATGAATVCRNEADARDMAAESAELWPRMAPYRIGRMLIVGDEP